MPRVFCRINVFRRYKMSTVYLVACSTAILVLQVVQIANH